MKASGSSEQDRCTRGRSEIPHVSSKVQLFCPCAGGTSRKTKKREKEKREIKSEEKRRKAKKSEEKRRKIPPTPSTPTPLRTSQELINSILEQVEISENSRESPPPTTGFPQLAWSQTLHNPFPRKQKTCQRPGLLQCSCRKQSRFGSNPLQRLTGMSVLHARLYVVEAVHRLSRDVPLKEEDVPALKASALISEQGARSQA